MRKRELVTQHTIERKKAAEYKCIISIRLYSVIVVRLWVQPNIIAQVFFSSALLTDRLINARKKNVFHSHHETHLLSLI
jgi:hypothetical protein